MKDPLIVKCNIMLSDAKIEEYRQIIIKQIKEDRVVTLPVGFELVTSEEADEIYKLYKGMSPKMQSIIKEIMEIEQKGKNK